VIVGGYKDHIITTPSSKDAGVVQSEGCSNGLYSIPNTIKTLQKGTILSLTQKVGNVCGCSKVINATVGKYIGLYE